MIDTPARLIAPGLDEHLVLHHRRQSGARLVEQQHRRLHHQRPAHRDHLALAAGQRPGPLVAPVAQRGEQRRSTKSKRRLEVLGALVDAHLQVLLDGQRREHVVGLRHEADPLGDQRVGALVGDVVALEAARVPEPILTRPNIALSSVDLPAPLGPMMPTSSPRRAVQVGAVEDVDAGHVAGDELARRSSDGRPRLAASCARSGQS